MHRHAPIAIGALLLALISVTECRAQDNLERARETMRRMRETREKRALAVTPIPFGHHLKKPEVPVDLPPSVKPPSPKPALKGSGTILMGGALRVLVGDKPYAVGDEIADGFRVESITTKKFIIRRDDLVYEYPVR